MDKVDVSSKALLRWARWVLAKKGVSLQDVSELGDGNKLARLVEGATAKTLPVGERSGGGGGGVAVGAKGVQNTFVLYSVLAFLSSEGIQIPQSCSPQVLAAGNREQIVGLLKRLAWQYLIMAFAAKESRRAADGGLIAWATQKLHQSDRVVSHKTLYNGEVVLALIEQATGSSALQSSDYGTLDADAKTKLLSEGFEAAQRELDIPQVVDASDFVDRSIDLTSLLIYLALLRHVLDGSTPTTAVASSNSSETNTVAVQQVKGATGVAIPPLQTDRVENGAQHALLGQQMRSTPREIAEMKQKMAEKDRELEEMKRKMEQTKREAEEEMKRLVEEIKSMKEKEKLSSTNSSIRTATDTVRSISSEGEEEAAVVVAELSPPMPSSSPAELSPPPMRKSSGGSQRKISPSPLATSSSASSSPSALRSSLSSRPSLPQQQQHQHTTSSTSPNSPPVSPSSSSSRSLRASPPKPVSTLPLPPLELQIEKIAGTVEPGGGGGNHGVLPTSPTRASARSKQQAGGGGNKKSSMLDNFIGHFEREMEYYEQEKASLAAQRPAVQNQQPLADVAKDEDEDEDEPMNEQESKEEAAARERQANEVEMARLKREVELQLADLEMEAELVTNDQHAAPSVTTTAVAASNRNVRSERAGSTGSPGRSPLSMSPQSSGSGHVIATATSRARAADNKGKQPMAMRDLVPKLCTDKAKTPPMEFMSPRTAEEIYTKIPSCYPLGDDDGDADVLLDTILMQIDLDRKKGHMSPRDKEDYEDYMREKRIVDKRKQHLLDEGLSAAFPPSPEELRRRDAGPMKMATPNSSSDDILATAGVRQRSHSSFSSSDSPTTRSRANTYHISELVEDDDYDTARMIPASPIPRDADHSAAASDKSKGKKKKKEEKEKKKKEEKEKKNGASAAGGTEPRPVPATMSAASSSGEVEAKRKKRNSLTMAFGSLKIKGTSSKEKRMSGGMRTTSFSSRFLPRSSSRDDPDKQTSPSSSPKMPKEPKKERSWRDLRSSFSFSGGSKGKVSKAAKGSAAGSSSPRHNKMRKTVDDSREGVKGVMIGLYDFHARKEDEISFNRGDLIYLMSDLDETGWALGKIKPRKRRMYESDGDNDERIGLFPVEFVRMAKEGEEQQAEDAEDEELLPPLPSSDSHGSFSSSSSSLDPDCSPPKQPRQTQQTLSSSLQSTPSSPSPPSPEGVNSGPDGAQGWLYFKHSSKKWISHYFVLTKDSLTYFKNQKPGKKPLGKITLAQAWLEVSRSLDEKQKKVHCILIATPAGKTYYMHAASKIDLDAWLDVFRTTSIAGLRQM